MAAVEAEKKVEVEEEQEKKEKAGELLFCGGTCWDAIGRRKGSIEGNLVSPTRLRPLLGVNIRFVATGCGNFLCHFVFQFFFIGCRNRMIRFWLKCDQFWYVKYCVIVFVYWFDVMWIYSIVSLRGVGYGRALLYVGAQWGMMIRLLNLNFMHTYIYIHTYMCVVVY